MATNFDKRASGIDAIGDLPWGARFCHFYQTKRDLLDILVPYLRAGLENNELCLWIASPPFDAEDAAKTLKSLPGCEKRNGCGQFEVVPFEAWDKTAASGRGIVSRIDEAILKGFAGLRVACSLPSGDSLPVLPFNSEIDAISRDNVISLVAYPRDDFDAARLMDTVKDYHYALVKNGGKWEVIQSSEARIAKEALRRSEEKLTSLFAHMEEAFAYHRIVLDAQGRPCDYVFLEVNDSFEKFTGLTRGDIIGKRVTEVLPGISYEDTDWIGIYGNVALTGKPARFDSYAQGLDRWYSVSAFCPHKGFFAVTFTDITDKKRFEGELLKAKIEWERTFDSVPDLIAIIDQNHRVLRANRAMAERLGVSPEQCTGMLCHEVVHGLPVAPGFCPLPLTCQDGQEHTVEVPEPRLGGDFLVSTTPLRDHEGRTVGVVHVARDITEQKRGARALQQRTQELEAANKELEAFSYSVSHDLRAPLRIMDGYSQALLEDYVDKLDEQGKEWLRYIRSSSQLMAQLISDILSLSRVVRSELKLEPVNLADMAHSIVERLRQIEPGRKAEFHIDPGLQATCDGNLLRLVLENLIGNAFKYTSRCETACIEFGSTAGEDGNRVFFVKDNGIGFDMKYVGKLFIPFQRLHSDSDFPGTGIGLATVQRIINRHGGTIRAEGETGKGAVFSFTLGQEAG